MTKYPTNIKPPLPPEFLARVRQLRRNATDAESLLWQLLRNRQLDGWIGSILLARTSSTFTVTRPEFTTSVEHIVDRRIAHAA